jgi:hypothetical protein
MSVRRRLFLLAGAAIAVAAAFTIIWFQPQKLVIDQRVNEEVPGRPAAIAEGSGESETSSSTGDQSRAQPAIETLGAGRFRPLAHHVSGRAELLELRNGDLYLRFENFEVENGPDLRVYAAHASATSDAYSIGKDFIDLGALKGNVGDQNYRIPAGASRRALNSAVIWCRRFSVGFAVAPIE